MSIRQCSDTSEAITLESSLSLYLKPTSKIKINVQLPKLKSPDQSISSYNVMEKLKSIIRPDEFIFLKSLKITPAVIKLEGELDTKSSCDRALARLKASDSLKLSGFSDWLHIRAAHAPSSGPTRHDWEAFFRDAKGVNEMRPGERPDTIHLEDLPVNWFSEESKISKPNERLLKRTFSSFGKIRRLAIPAQEANEASTIGKTNSSHTNPVFEAYIQYEEYVEFAMAMDALRGKKLMHKDSNGLVFTADIKVDFDRTNYLSDKCIRQRENETQRSTQLSCHQSTSLKPDEESPLSDLITVVKNEVPETKIINNPCDTVEKLTKNECQHLLKHLLLKAEDTEKKKFESNDSLNTKNNSQDNKAKSTNSDVSYSKSSKSKKRKLASNVTEEKHKGKLESKARSTEKPTKKKIRELNEKYEFKLPVEENAKKNMLLDQEKILKERLLRNLKAREEQKILELREHLRKKLAGQKTLKSVLSMKS